MHPWPMMWKKLNDKRKFFMSSKVLKFIIFLKTIYSTNLSINYKYRVFVIYIPRYILYIRKIIWTLQAMCQYADDHQTTNLIVLKKLLVYNCYCKQILKWLTFVFKLICWSPYVSNYRKKKEICLSVASRPPDLLPMVSPIFGTWALLWKFIAQNKTCFR